MWKRITKSGKVKYSERYTDYLTGKPKDISVTFEKDSLKNQKEAMRILSDRIAAKQSCTKPNLTLSGLIEEYRKDQKLTVSVGTYKRNYHAMETIKKMLGSDILVERLTARYVRNKFLESGRSAGTLNGLLSRFKALIRWAYHAELIDTMDLAYKLERFNDISHKAKIADKFLEASELRAVLDHMNVPIWKLVTQFLALSGLRCGELIALEKSDVDTDEGVIHITKSYDSFNRLVVNAKTASSVDDVVIQPELLQCIKDINNLMLEEQMLYRFRTNLFISDRNGEHINYYTYNKYLKENTLAIVGRALTTHSLRHTHASLLFEQGFTLDEVARRLRHGDSKVTREVYIHVTKKLREKDAEKIKSVSIL